MAIPIRLLIAVKAWILLVVLPGTLFAQKKPAPPVAFDQATMVIMAPSGPVFADLRISVARIPYRRWVGKFLATQLDRDNNGHLNIDELGLLTENIRRLARISSPAEIIRKITDEKPDSEAAVTDISTSAFADWLSNELPKAFDLIAQPQSSDDAVRLSSLLDTNQNSTISDEELLAAFRTLRFRDLDNDETFSVSELLPYRDPRSQNAPVSPDVVSLPFFHVTDRPSLELVTDRILKRYGDDGTVNADVFRDSIVAAPDQSFNATELYALIEKPSYHLTIDVRLSDKANASDVTVTVAPGAANFCRVAEHTTGQTALAVDGLMIRIFARGGGANNRAVTRGFLGQTFVMLDGDRNQYLDENEFDGMLAPLQQAGATGTFSNVDQNSDGMITRDELFAYVDRDQMAAASRIEVTVRQDGKTLFGILDANTDRRLSAREVRSGTEALREFDLNGDGTFAETELGTEYMLTLGLGRPELRRNQSMGSMMNMQQMGTGDAILPGTAGLSGPEWFRRMDRNQDGDVSAREFLGTPEQFKLLDTDHDGLVSAAEAQAIPER